MTVNQLIGTQIRYLRTKLGLSGVNFGARLETYLGEPWTRQTVYEAETGKRDFRVEEIFALAKAGNVTVQFFLSPLTHGGKPKTSMIEWRSGAKAKLPDLIDLLRAPGEPTRKPDEVRAARKLLKAAQQTMRNADEILKFVGDPEDAEL